MISVIVPVYNIDKYIERCIKSILNQTYEDFELLLVDDGSIDRSGEICDKYASLDDRIHTYHKINGGVSSARNLALNNIKGDYISIIDGDDWIEPNMFKDCIELINKYRVQVVMFEYFIENENNSIQHLVKNSNYGLLSTEQALINTISPNNRFACTKFFSAKLLKDNKFCENIILGEDTLFISNILSNANLIYYSKTPYYHYEQRENSAVRSDFNMKKLSGLDAYKKQLNMCIQHGFSLPAEYARGALIELAVALARRAYESGGDDAAKAFKIIKSYIVPEIMPSIKSNNITLKTKFKSILSLFSLKLTCIICGKFGG